MSDNLKAAAERVRRYLNGESLQSVYSNSDNEFLTVFLDADKLALIEAMLELLDDTPIDDEWAEKMTTPQRRTGSVQFDYATGDTWLVEVRDIYNGDVIGSGFVRTRGQVRAKLIELGVEP